jgi:hypothetical protein
LIDQKWNGQFWENDTFYRLGLVHQLGHEGNICECPGEERDMTVFGNNIVQRVKIQFCNCSEASAVGYAEQCLRMRWYPASLDEPRTCATFEMLDLFRVLSVVGQVNVRDFVTSLECLKDGVRKGDEPVRGLLVWFQALTLVQDRYKTFSRMQRQWAFLQRMKRAGRAHSPSGIGGTSDGQAAVLCWACPHDGINLPEGWQDRPDSEQYVSILDDCV